MIVELGNSSTKGAYRDSDGELAALAYEGDRVTTVNIPAGYTMGMALQCITAPDGVWFHHSRHDPETGAPVPPAWVESDSPGLAAVLAEAFGGIPTRRPDRWGDDTDLDAAPTPIDQPAPVPAVVPIPEDAS